MKAKLQYNIGTPFNSELQNDLTNIQEIMFTGSGGDQIMSTHKRNIPLILIGNISDEIQIKDNLYTNVIKNLSNIDITNVFNGMIDGSDLIAPFRLVIIPYTNNTFDMAPRLILRECLYANIFNYFNNYIDITNNIVNNEFINRTMIGDMLSINNIVYKVNDIYNINNGKRFILDKNLDTQLKIIKVININKFKLTNLSFMNKNNQNKFKSMFKILYVTYDSSAELEYDFNIYDDATVLLFNNSNSQKLKNLLFNIPVQLDEFQNNIFNKVDKIILSSYVSQNSNTINVMNPEKIKVGDYLLVDFTDGTNVINIEMKVKNKNNNIIYVEWDNSRNIPVNANVYRNLDYKFYLFVYPEEFYNYNNFDNVVLTLEYI